MRITAGGNVIKYLEEISTRTADLTTYNKSDMELCTGSEPVKYMCLNIEIFSLETSLDRYEYMKMHIALFPS